MPNLLELAARKLAAKKKKPQSDEDDHRAKRERLEVAVTEFEKAETASEKVDALRAFIELANA